jgi:hypothetical protein
MQGWRRSRRHLMCERAPRPAEHRPPLRRRSKRGHASRAAAATANPLAGRGHRSRSRRTHSSFPAAAPSPSTRATSTRGQTRSAEPPQRRRRRRSPSWRSARLAPPLLTTPFAATPRVAVLAGRPQHCRQQALHADGAAAVLAPGFTPSATGRPTGERHLTTSGGAVWRLANTRSLPTMGRTSASMKSR